MHQSISVVLPGYQIQWSGLSVLYHPIISVLISYDCWRLRRKYILQCIPYCFWCRFIPNIIQIIIGYTAYQNRFRLFSFLHKFSYLCVCVFISCSIKLNYCMRRNFLTLVLLWPITFFNYLFNNYVLECLNVTIRISNYEDKVSTIY